MSYEALGVPNSYARERALLNGKVSILFALSQHYLFLPFAALCMAAALVHRTADVSVVATPLVLQIAATTVASRLKQAFDARSPEDDPKIWAQRYTILSGAVGAIWGVGAIIWFVPDSFPAQAYLVLAYLGMTATEFVARASYRPAYLAHAALSLGPLALLLLVEGELYQMLTAVLVMFFGGVLYSYSGTVAQLLEESILLRHDNAELIVRMSQEKRAAEGARDMAQASERSKSAFISNISHEIRTPLNAILGMAQLLERSDLEKAQRDHIKVLLEAGRGLKTLLDDIIALAQQPEESVIAPDEGCDAGQATRTVVRLLQPNAWEKRLRLSINVASNLPRVAADPRLLRRVLLKLVGNAIKFTERGNIEVALDASSDETGRKMVRFSVTDTGPGIPNHLLATIFQPFAKTDDSYGRRHSGAGVGLAVAKRLVESIGGTIGVESEPGMGASFWVTFPALQTAVVEESSSGEHVTAPSGKDFLAYLPDPAMVAALDRLLTPFGNKIVFAQTLGETASLSARERFALIIATASAVDGLAAMPGQQTPILALASAEERQPDGADTVLRWPSASSALYAAINTAMGATDSKNSEAAKEANIDAAIDAKAFAELEKSLGFKTLIDILQSYMGTAEELATSLAVASEREEWPQVGRVAQDFAGAAGGLGLSALTSAARLLAQNARDGAPDPALFSAAGEVLAQHQRVREALRRLYPDLAA